MSAQVPADALLNAGRINVTAANPDGAVSNALPFTIESDTPTISRVNPNSVVAGSGEVTIAVTGGGFVRGSSVTANGNGLATTFNSATSLDAIVPADLTVNIREHLFACEFVPTEVRWRAEDARDAARRLIKQRYELSNQADVLLHQAESAISALREAMKRVTWSG